MDVCDSTLKSVSAKMVGGEDYRRVREGVANG